jgi:pyochelin biosynthetic protein PchC
VRGPAVAVSADRHVVLVPEPAEATGATMLLYLPGVGGTGREAKLWQSTFPDVVVTTAVRRPTRVPEPGLEERAAMLNGLLLPLAPSELVVVGHSLGAVVGYELALLLERTRPKLLRSLVVAGQLAPHRLQYRSAAGLTTPAILRRMREGSALPLDLAEVDGLLETLVPQWRAELRALEEYRRAETPGLDLELHVWSGTVDPTTRDREALAAWSDCAADVRFREFDGGHDFLFGDRGDVLSSLSTLLAVPQVRA